MNSKAKIHDPVRDYGYIAAGLALLVVSLAVFTNFMASADFTAFFE